MRIEREKKEIYIYIYIYIYIFYKILLVLIYLLKIILSFLYIKKYSQRYTKYTKILHNNTICIRYYI